MVIDDDGGSAGKSDSWPKRPTDAGDGFVTSVRGLFSSQKRKAKNLVLRKMRSDGENEILQGEWSESEAEFSPIARQLSGSRAKKLIRRHTKKFNPGLQQGDPSFHFQFLSSVFVCIFICAMRINLFISTSAVSSVDGESIPTSPPDNSDSSSESSPYEEEREERENKEEGEIKEERENKEERE